ncbi:MAG: hypothetical protein GX605_04575 [Chloroflexi bacterium]|nr:hypothetical protein [Chloroflexota bacterium]
MQGMQQDLAEFREQLDRGAIQRAYRALIAYMMGLRAHFQSRFPGYAVSGLYQGYMDMTYFALVPPSFKQRSLKVAIVFNYGAFRFEAWLAAGNRQVQRQYWELFRDSQWPAYRVVAPAKGVDSIVESDLAETFDLSDPAPLTARIETATAAFMADMERFLAEHAPRDEAEAGG